MANMGVDDHEQHPGRYAIMKGYYIAFYWSLFIKQALNMVFHKHIL